MQIVWLMLCGMAGGVLGGMGMGGGTLLIPMLSIFFGIEQHAAQAVNLIAFIPMSVIALAVHFKNKLVDVKTAIKVVLPAAAATAGGAFLCKVMSADILKRLFGGFLALLAVYQVIQIIVTQKKKKARTLADSAEK